MKNSKEFPNAKGKNVAQGATTTIEKTAELKVCHPSVCIGNQKPTSCVCITSK